MPTKPARPIRIRSLLLSAVVAWTAAVAVSLAWNHHETRQAVPRLATIQARAAFEKDLVYRRWNAVHGGVYVPVTADTPPNPLLAHLPHRDVVTGDGARLTLVNPAYMARQVFEMGHEMNGVEAHLTSSRPLRPENAPDRWEAAALHAIEAGASEFHEVAELRGAPHLRYMGRLVTEQRCLVCHAAQGDRVGVARGGISVAIPLAGHLASARGQARALAASHGLIWLFGLAVLAVTGGRARGRERARERDEEALRQAWQQLDVAIRGGAVSLWEWDLPTGAVRWGARGLPPLGRSGGELADTAAIMALTHPDDLAQVRAEVDACVGGASDKLDVEFRYRAAEGGWRWAIARGNVVARGPGAARTLAGSLADVTPLRRAEEERERLEQQLVSARRLEAVGRLAGGVAHDLNNLLTPILGCAELARESLPADSPAQEDLAQVREAAERARELTRRLLAFGRKQVLEVAALDLSSVVEGLVPMLQRLLPENVAVELALRPGLPVIRADRAQLELAIVNLAANARDAMPAGGTLRVSTATTVIEAEAARPLEVEAGTFVALEVGDTGTGIAPEVLEHLFEPFFTTKALGKGTGLGLASVHGLMKQHRGAVAVESTVGLGTTFRLFFPASGDAAADLRAGHAPPARARARAGGSERVLLAEDDPAVRRYVASVLRDLGYRVTEAADGEGALLRSEGGAAPDLLVTDVLMPRMSGAELHRRLAARWPCLPVLFISGHPRDAFGPGVLPPAGAPLIAKPFAPVELAAAVRAALDRVKALAG